MSLLIEKKKKTTAKKKTFKIPRTVQDSIPYVSVYPEFGIIETDPGVFSKSYSLKDINFTNETDERQNTIYDAFGTLLNSFDSSMMVQFSNYNRNTDIDVIRNEIFMKNKKDNNNKWRECMNDALAEEIKLGHNDITKEKYLTISVTEKNIDIAKEKFKTIDLAIQNAMMLISDNDIATPFTIEDRLDILNDIYHMDNKNNTLRRKAESFMNNGRIDFNKLANTGIKTKDLIGPMSFTFNKKNFMVGDMFGCAGILSNYPTMAVPDIIPEITNVSGNLLVSVVYKPLETKRAIQMIKNRRNSINANLVAIEKHANQNGYNAAFISPELRDASEETDELLQDVIKNDNKIFECTVLVCAFGNTMEELNEHIEALRSTCESKRMSFEIIDFQQERCFDSCLPLALREVEIKRIMPTESASVFIPFSSQEMMQNGINSFVYGLNSLTKNLVRYDRSIGENHNGAIFGKSGTGKSTTAKREISNVILKTDDDILIIDPDGEYGDLVRSLGGVVIDVEIGGKAHINACDLDFADVDDGINPITAKCDAIAMYVETMTAANGNIYGFENSLGIIHRCGEQMYQNYTKQIMNASSIDKSITSDTSICPSFEDFYSVLCEQPENDAEAQRMAKTIEIYAVGAYNLFSQKTNVDLSSRILCFNLSNIGGAGLLELGLQVCTTTCWNRMLKNNKRGRNTRLYIDEFHVLMQHSQSAIFMKNLWKRARKFHGYPTLITQDVEDVLSTEEGRGILNNCAFVYMLSQSQTNREKLMELYNIPEALEPYITDKPRGCGILYTPQSIIPIETTFPADKNELFKLMSTSKNKR